LALFGKVANLSAKATLAALALRVGEKTHTLKGYRVRLGRF